ncbi:MAG: response regulator [Bacteroidia bacterium]|nr:response regulator [Bacteroidia bacterium]
MVKPLVVIIDDEEDLLDLYEYNFAKRGFEVITFLRAKSALEFLQKNQPDIILCDWMMPDMDGLDFCKRIKSNLKLADIPFMMVTCKTEKSAIRQALAAGVSDYVAKPIGMDELVAKVNFILNSDTTSLTGTDS